MFQLNRSVRATRVAADPWNVVVPRARLDVRKYAYVVRAADKWNGLDREEKAAATLKQFKASLNTNQP